MDLEREKLYAYDGGLEKGLAQRLEEGAKKKSPGSCKKSS